MEELMGCDRSIFKIGPENPHIGKRICVTYKRGWNKKPVGYSVTGSLVRTFTPNGRTLIGIIKGKASDEPATMRDQDHTVPWSRNYIEVMT